MDPQDVQGHALPGGPDGRWATAVDEQRWFQLWLLMTAVLVTISTCLAVVGIVSPGQPSALLGTSTICCGVLGFVVVVGAHVRGRERALRRVRQLLEDEQVLTGGLRERLQEISSLLDAGRAVNSTLELDRVLASILSSATGLLDASGGSVMLVEGDELVVVAAVGNDEAMGRRAQIGTGVAGHVARTQQPLLLDGRVNAVRFPGLQRRANTVASSLCVPLIERGQLLGVLNVHADAQGVLSECDVRTVSLFAEQASAAIAKARLYARSQEQALELADAARHDPLTGLGNRVALQERATGFEALLFMDLDGFKQINDRHGHAAGDAVLVAVAQRVKGHVAAGDLVARFGGDEFAVLLEVSGRAHALLVAERILAAISECVSVEGQLVLTAASIGIALPAPDGTALSVLLRQADGALYEAKASGKACVRIFEEPSVVADLMFAPPQPRSAVLREA